jgi:hypothetical protein
MGALYGSRTLQRFGCLWNERAIQGLKADSEEEKT